MFDENTFWVRLTIQVDAKIPLPTSVCKSIRLAITFFAIPRRVAPNDTSPVTSLLTGRKFSGGVAKCLDMGDHIPTRSLPFFRARLLLSTLLNPVTQLPPP